MLIGVGLKIDVTKIDKARLFKGAKGTYLDATVFIDVDNVDQYGNNGMLTQAVSEEERKAGVKGAILGNSKVFMKKGGQDQYSDDNVPQPQQPRETPPMPDFNTPAGEDEVPF